MPEATITEQRFDQYMSTIISSIGHADRTVPMRDYCYGLLLPGERKSIEPMAARVDPAHLPAKHQSMHHFIADAPWSDEAVMRAIIEYTIPIIETNAPIDAWIVDDTGFPKKGRHSVGVSRQYCGRVGKQENCQVAVSVSVANEHASLPVGLRLYLPEEWANDPERRQKAGVPERLWFQTKPTIAIDIIEHLLTLNVPRGVVLADAAYGNDTLFRHQLTENRLTYVVGIQSTTTVWRTEEHAVPSRKRTVRTPSRGQSRKNSVAGKALSVLDIARMLGESSFQRIRWREGSSKPLESRFWCGRVRRAHRLAGETLPPDEEWLLIEWPDGEPAPTKYWFSTLPGNSTLRRLVQVAKMRWRIERDYEELKSEIGLGHFEGRGWRGFHHHATMCIAAYAFLVAERGLFPPEEEHTVRPFRVASIPAHFKPRGSSDKTGKTR
jgi:SRSO17 transposase